MSLASQASNSRAEDWPFWTDTLWQLHQTMQSLTDGDGGDRVGQREKQQRQLS